ncbi:hypothetical protein [Marinomonas balearica]|uniref:Uncharacterized protein n=1 Tax=Marinomonas balearica TaxID=491947 RepID=A0A4R6M796_9GAMM|nr:hypothetical protein [Marinomonas balearica]TDO96480.1 hypothetical protein DFP79_3060 [Marinomonas balearica]
MENNLIQFPLNTKSTEQLKMDSDTSSTAQTELEELRGAFDDARKEWPLEFREFPETNRIIPAKLASSKVARS